MFESLRAGVAEIRQSLKERPENDKYWLELKREYNWAMPKSYWIQRLPVIRWFRYLYNHIKIALWARLWQSQGYLCLSEHDEWVLYGIYRGFK